MQTATVATVGNEHNGLIGTEAQPEEMEREPQSGFNMANIAISLLALILGVVGGLLASVAANSEWKGKMEQRMDNYEKQRTEDKASWEYIRSQNEVNGKILTQIQAELNANGKKGR